MGAFVLAIDQGTTSTRAIVFDGAFEVRGSAQQELAQGRALRSKRRRCRP